MALSFPVRESERRPPSPFVSIRLRIELHVHVRPAHRLGVVDHVHGRGADPHADRIRETVPPLLRDVGEAEVGRAAERVEALRLPGRAVRECVERAYRSPLSVPMATT